MEIWRRFLGLSRRTESHGPPPGFLACQEACQKVVYSTPTTTFTPPTSCLDYWTPVATFGTISPKISFNRTRRKPNAYLREFNAGICPSGWPAASTGVADGQTTQYCCPPALDIFSLDATRAVYGTCLGTFSNSLMTLIYNSTWTASSTNYSTITAPGSTSSTAFPVNMTYVTERVETIFVYSGTLAAKPIIVTFKENQVSTGAVAATSATSSPQISVGPSSSSELGVSDQERLSAGAKAGVGVGVAVGACTLALLACFFLYRSRKRKTTHAESTPGWRTPELSGNPMGAKELHNDAMTVKEMSNDTMTPQELPSTLRPRVN